MKTLNRTDFTGPSYPEKILQFGEGNFLRAFVDWQIDILNEHTSFNSGVTIVRPINSDFPPSLSTQDGLYTTLIRGINEAGEAVKEPRIIRSVNRELNIYTSYQDVMDIARSEELKMVFSNTTEAGIAYNPDDQIEETPPSSYPAKLTQFLYVRYCHFEGAEDKGLTLFPCELIDYNGEALKEIVLKYADLWELETGFKDWLNNANTFCSTLVDRIVTGFPRDEHSQLEEEFGYHDQFVDTAEYFYLFVIQGPQSLRKDLCLDELPESVKMNILVTDDIKPYKERKVAILNGAHTAMVPVAYLAGLDTVGESMDDEQILRFVEQAIFNEIIPTLDLPESELVSFANDVLKRFRNPFIRHQLLSISLNSMTKFRTRILPQLLRFQETKGTLPRSLVFALAALLTFYRGDRDGQEIPLQDDAFWLQSFRNLWGSVDQGAPVSDLVNHVLGNEEHWGQDLTQVPGLSQQVSSDIESILAVGLRQALTEL